MRHHGELARLELKLGELERALELRVELIAAIQAAGYRVVTLDLAGYRSGSLSVLRSGEGS